MRHDDCEEFIPRSPNGKVKVSENVHFKGEDVGYGLSQSNNIQRFSSNDSLVSSLSSKESFLFSSSNCHGNSLMAKPTSSCSYFSPKTGTSIVHITSNSSGSSTVRENSMYIEKQWAMLKEKMLPSSKKQNSESDIREHLMTEFVEERCEVDFSFIDEPNGNELDNAYAKHSDSFKSKNLTGHTSSVTFGTSSCNANYNASISSLSASMQASDENPNQLALDKPAFSIAPISFDFKKDRSEDILKHSSHEMLKNDHIIDSFITRRTDGPLLVKSYKEEFLSSTNSLLISQNVESNQKSHDKPCLISQDAQSLKISDGANIYKESIQNCESKSRNVTDVSLGSPVLSDPKGKGLEQGVSKSSEVTSKRYQEMQRKKSKKKLKELNTITSNQVPDYKGDNSLEEIISFINKDMKVSQNALSSKTKKSKKKSLKKDSPNVKINGSDLHEPVACCIQSNEKNDQPKECFKSHEVSLSCDDDSKPENSVNGIQNSKATGCSARQGSVFHSIVHENEIDFSKNSSVDCDQFSVVKKKKKLKTKPINVNKSILEKSLSSDSCLLNDRESLDFSTKNQKNEANMNMKANVLVTEQHIPQNCQFFQSGNNKSNQPSRMGNDQTPRNTTDSAKKIHLEGIDHNKFKQNFEKSDTTQNIIVTSCLPYVVPQVASQPVIKINTNESRNEAKVQEHTLLSKPDFQTSFSKSKSAFNLRHAQEFMNSTYQEVIKKKGYILYGHS